MNRILVLFLLLTAFSLSSCKKKVSKSRIAESVLNNDFTFDYFVSKAKVGYLSKDDNLSTAVQIRIRQDSAIWMSIAPALGIEMMRILIRTDSVFMINRLKKEYYAGSFDIVKRQLGLGVSYKLLETMLLGNIPLKNASNQKVTKTETHYLLEQMLTDFTITNAINKDLARLERLNFKGNNSDINTKIRYSDFEVIDEVSFAKKIAMNQVINGEVTKVDIKYSRPKVSSEPVNMSFNIPSNYEEIKLK